MAWSGIIDRTVIGPYFFEANVSGDSYLEMLVDFLLPTLHRNGLNASEICYMHDGAPPHIPAPVRQCLDDNFRCWIGRCEGVNKLLPWPPRSPDLNMLDFFFWGTLQHRVYLVQEQTIEEIEESIITESREMSAESLGRTQLNLVKRLRKCIEVDGHLFEHLMK